MYIKMVHIFRATVKFIKNDSLNSMTESTMYTMYAIDDIKNSVFGA